MTQRRTGIAGLLLAAALLAGGCFGPQTPLGKAVSRGALDEVNALLKAGADPCARAGRGDYTPLDLAGGSTRDILWKDELKERLYTALLDAAFNQVTGGKQCEHILLYAARVGDVDKIRQLIALGWNPNLEQEDWETSALGIAAYYGHEQAAAVLIAGGADVAPQIENFEKMRLWATTIGKETGYLKASAALQLLTRLRDAGTPHAGAPGDNVQDQEHVQ